MTDEFLKVADAVKFIRTKVVDDYSIGIVLGTGLGGMVENIQIDHSIDYSEIPHFPVSTVESHKGKLLFGTVSGRKVIAMQGRFHFYEGYALNQVVFPIRVMKYLGINTLLISNACGGMNPLFRRGDVMIITDHINLIGGSPLSGKHSNEFGPRFVDMSQPYSQALISMAEEIGLKKGIKIQQGVYVAVPGPNLETRAEYRFLRMIGADVVGMSTVPEVIAANQLGISVLGLSIVTDECFPDALKPCGLEEIIAAAGKAEPKVTLIMKEVIERL